MKKIITVFFLTFTVGCSNQTIELSGDIEIDAPRVLNMIEKRTKSNNSLTDQELEKVGQFVNMYATTSQKDKESLIATYIAALNLYNLEMAITEDDDEKTRNSIKYKETLEKLKIELDNM